MTTIGAIGSFFPICQEVRNRDEVNPRRSRCPLLQSFGSLYQHAVEW